MATSIDKSRLYNAWHCCLFFASFVLLAGYSDSALSAPASQITGGNSTKILPVYLFNSQRARDYFTSVGGNYELILSPWRDYFQSRDITYREIQHRELQSGLKPGVLILPSVIALEDSEKIAIQAFEQAGGSILATWVTGARDGTEKWRNYEFLSEQFGIKVTGEISQSTKGKDNFLVVFGNTPAAHTLPAGSHIWFDQTNTLPLQVTGGSHIAARFMDVVHSPSATANEAIVFTETDTSRRAYFAFAETLWQFQPADMYRLLDDVLNWLQRTPAAYLADWPFPYHAAQIVEMDTEQEFQNSRTLAEMLESNGLRGTFYCLTSIAAQNAATLNRLAGKHEIAFHGDVHDSFKNQSRETQSRRLKTMRHELAPLLESSENPTGFRPPYELYDQTTESLLLENGYSHILANSYGSKAMLPYLASVSPKDFSKGLIVLPRTHKGDIDFVMERKSTAEMTKIMNEELDRTLEIGSLGVLSLHSQNFNADSSVTKSTSAFLNRLKHASNTIWAAPSRSIESWWRERALIAFKLSGAPDAMQLNVTVAQPGVQRKPAIVITNPAKGLTAKISTELRGAAAALAFPLDEYRTAIVFDATAPGQYRYSLSYQ